MPNAGSSSYWSFDIYTVCVIVSTHCTLVPFQSVGVGLG